MSKLPNGYIPMAYKRSLTFSAYPRKRARYSGKRPLVRKTRYRRKRYTRKPTSVRAIVRREVRRNVEVKKINVVGANTVSNSSLFNAISNFADANQGTNDANRIGNQIVGIGNKFKLRVRNTSANPLYFRCMAFWFLTEEGTNNATLNSQIFVDMSGASQSWTSIVDTPGVLNFPFNKRAGRLLYDKTIRLARNTETNSSDCRSFQPFMKFQQKINFNEVSSGVQEQDARLCIAWFAYNPNQSLGTPATFTYNWDYNNTFYFTDS